MDSVSLEIEICSTKFFFVASLEQGPSRSLLRYPALPMVVALTLMSMTFLFRELFFSVFCHQANDAISFPSGTAKYSCQNVNITGNSAKLFPACTIT